MPDSTRQTGLPALVRVLRRRWRLIAVCTALVPLAALAFSLSQTKKYSAAATLLFRDPGFDQKLFGSTYLPPSKDPAREAATNLGLAELGTVAERTARALGPQYTTADVLNSVELASEGQSDLVTITATTTRPTESARLANTYAARYIQFRRDADRAKIREAEQLVARQIAALPSGDQTGERGRDLAARQEQLKVFASLQTGNAELVQVAGLPKSPSSPKTPRNVVLGLIAGLALGVGLAVSLSRFDRRIVDPEELQQVFGRPLLAAIPQERSGAEPGSLPSEPFQMLRANLRYFNLDREITCVLVTSASASEGKSTVSLNLARAAASAGRDTLLIEADLRNPTLASRLGMSWQGGLSQVLTGAQNVATASYAFDDGTVGDRLEILPAGPIPPNPADLLESQHMGAVLRDARNSYDFVVIDTPPLGVVADVIPLLPQVDGLLIVARIHRVTRDAARRLGDQLENLSAPTLGVVANFVPLSDAYGYGYGYGYGQAASLEPTG